MPTESKEESGSKRATDVLVEWNAPARPFKKRDRSFYITEVALVALLIVILFFVREWLIVGVSLSVVFVASVLAAVPPPTIVYKITQKGIWIDETFYKYAELSEFWFEEYLQSIVLVVTIPTRRIARLNLVVSEDKRGSVYDALREHLVFREKPLKTATDAAADWLRKKIPLEESGSNTTQNS